MTENNKQTKPKKAKVYHLTVNEYRKKTRNEERLSKIKQKVAELSRITKQIESPNRLGK